MLRGKWIFLLPLGAVMALALLGSAVQQGIPVTGVKITTPAGAAALSTTSPSVMPPAILRSSSLPAASTPQGLGKTSTALPSPTPMRLTPGPDDWMNLPVIPTLSPRALEIIQDGRAQGRDPRAFSKVGDCESTSWFLTDFDRGPGFYDLGPYSNLQPVIHEYAGSFGRASLAVKNGFTASSVLTPLWSSPNLCGTDESPLACEYRLHNPSVALITLGTNDASNPERVEVAMRSVIEQTLARGILPVLATKADNLEGDHHINRTIARLAWEYELPLWNFWRAVQDLPGNGLQEDLAHLTFAPNQFSDPANLQYAWPVRNLTALQVLGSIQASAAKNQLFDRPGD